MGIHDYNKKKSAAVAHRTPSESPQLNLIVIRANMVNAARGHIVHGSLHRDAQEVMKTSDTGASQTDNQKGDVCSK